MEAAFVVVAGVQGDDPQVAARDDVLVSVGVIEDEGEDPVQPVQEAAALFGVERQDDLAVAAGLEFVGAREPGFQLTVVVDLSVDSQDVGAAGAAKAPGPARAESVRTDRVPEWRGRSTWR